MEFKEELEELKRLKKVDDPSIEHYEGDRILVNILLKLGYSEIVEAYEELSKWYE